LGFSDKANLDDGDMWPTDWPVKELTAAVERLDPAQFVRISRGTLLNLTMIPVSPGPAANR
jgi:hypothetical protein